MNKRMRKKHGRVKRYHWVEEFIKRCNDKDKMNSVINGLMGFLFINGVISEAGQMENFLEFHLDHDVNGRHYNYSSAEEHERQVHDTFLTFLTWKVDDLCTLVSKYGYMKLKIQNKRVTLIEKSK